jgi:hypothetical protein
MIKIISDKNIASINATATDIMALLKAEKFFFVNEFNGAQRIKPTCSLIELSRAFSTLKHHKYLRVTAPNDVLKKELEKLTATLCGFLGNKSQNTCQKIKDYSGDIKPKLCRELISYLESMLIMGDIECTDIEDVYASLNKPVPKKFKGETLSQEGIEVYNAIHAAINDNAQEIKADSVKHYIDMVNRIDPNDEISAKEEFLKACYAKFSDITTLRLCMAYKFDNAKFQSMINDAFDSLVLTAASKITDHYRGTSKKPSVVVKSIELGGKGFDLAILLDNQLLNARAITVEGHYVRFHYRYIVT